ncbi:hypothetical protein BC835DRAFT_1412429 [Cytidiella melzeri]|nr:hypothetical protein BC835DRAFT_1412429 [Cytidiella melzeri]
MDAFDVLAQQLSPEAAAAIQQLINQLNTELQEARQVAQAAQDSLLSQEEFAQTLLHAFSHAHLAVQNPVPPPAPAMCGSLRVAPQHFSGNVAAADGNVNHCITIFCDAVGASDVPPDLWVPMAATYFDSLALC